MPALGAIGCLFSGHKKYMNMIIDTIQNRIHLIIGCDNHFRTYEYMVESSIHVFSSEMSSRA